MILFEGISLMRLALGFQVTTTARVDPSGKSKIFYAITK